MMKIQIHEDDEGMRNLYPAVAAAEVLADLDQAQRSAEENLAPDGMGWTDIHLVQSPQITYLPLRIPVASVAKVLSATLPRIKKFEVGYQRQSPFHYAQRWAQCYGFDKHLFIKLERRRRYLSGIWFEAATDDAEQLLALRQAFHSVNCIVPSMVADYWSNSGGLLDDKDFLDRYFNSLAA